MTRYSTRYSLFILFIISSVLCFAQSFDEHIKEEKKNELTQDMTWRFIEKSILLNNADTLWSITSKSMRESVSFDLFKATINEVNQVIKFNGITKMPKPIESRSTNITNFIKSEIKSKEYTLFPNEISKNLSAWVKTKKDAVLKISLSNEPDYEITSLNFEIKSLPAEFDLHYKLKDFLIDSVEIEDSMYKGDISLIGNFSRVYPELKESDYNELISILIDSERLINHNSLSRLADPDRLIHLYFKKRVEVEKTNSRSSFNFFKSSEDPTIEYLSIILPMDDTDVMLVLANDQHGYFHIKSKEELFKFLEKYFAF